MNQKQASLKIANALKRIQAKQAQVKRADPLDYWTGKLNPQALTELARSRNDDVTAGAGIGALGGGGLGALAGGGIGALIAPNGVGPDGKKKRSVLNTILSGGVGALVGGTAGALGGGAGGGSLAGKNWDSINPVAAKLLAAKLLAAKLLKASSAKQSDITTAGRELVGKLKGTGKAIGNAVIDHPRVAVPAAAAAVGVPAVVAAKRVSNKLNAPAAAGHQPAQPGFSVADIPAWAMAHPELTGAGLGAGAGALASTLFRGKKEDGEDESPSLGKALLGAGLGAGVGYGGGMLANKLMSTPTATPMPPLTITPGDLRS